MSIENIYFGGPNINSSEKNGITETIAFNGVLFLTEDPDELHQQIESREVIYQPQNSLLSNISTLTRGSY